MTAWLWETQNESKAIRCKFHKRPVHKQREGHLSLKARNDHVRVREMSTDDPDYAILSKYLELWKNKNLTSQ